MGVDISKLDEGLQKLRGLDFEAAEVLIRRKHPETLEVGVLKEFQARIAAIALGVPYEDVAELPIRTYATVTQKVLNFLYGNSELATPAGNSEA